MKSVLTILFSFITITLLAQAKYTPVKAVPGPPDKEYASPLFSGIDGTYFDLRDDNTAISASSYINILDWLQGPVAGLQVYQVRGVPVAFIRNMPATVFLDEMRVSSDMLWAVSVADIALVKVIKTASVLAAPGGAIVIYTKKGEAEDGEE